MYDKAITQAAIDRESEALGWELTRYDSGVIRQAVAHFEEMWDHERQRLKRPLIPDEQKFIQNERKLCRLDFHYWISRYATIVNWEKQPQQFVPNVAQQIIMDLWAEDEADGHAIWMQQLKARRLGVSTLSELNVCHRFQFTPFSNCVVASADPDKTIEMAGMIKYCLDQQPWWLLPQGTPKIKHGIPVGFPDLHNTLSIQAGNQFTGVATGSSPNVVHLSELFDWQDAAQLIDEALLPAILDDPKVFVILESTGGPGWWEEKWKQTKTDWARGTARMRPIFLPWYVGTDIYPTPAWLRKIPIPDGWIPEDRTVTHAERARKYVLSNPLLMKYLAKGDTNWEMPREQMWYREVGYRSAKEQKTLHIHLSQYASDEFEAFQTQQNPIIDQEIIIGYRERTRDPLAVYTIIGPDIPPSLVASSRYFDSSKPTVTIKTREILPRYDATFQLVPLVFTGYPDLDEQLKFLVWELPQEPYIYGVGVDTSEGIGLDNAIINVLREATPSREPGQVAEWAGNTVTAFQLWPMVMAVATWYSTVLQSIGERRQCKLAIETWSNGASCQYELQKRGWGNFHEHYYAGDARKPKAPGSVNRIGVITNASLRASIQDYWMTCLKEEAIDIPSPFLVAEIETLENVNGKAQAMLGKHDDRWMSLGFPLYSLHRNKPPSKQFTRKRVTYQPGLDPDDQVAHPIWTPPAQGSSRPFSPSAAPISAQPVLRYRDHGALGRAYHKNLPIKLRRY